MKDKVTLSTTVESYMKTHLSRGVTFASLLTVDDGVKIPSADGNGTTFFVGYPDGLGAYDGAIINESDYFYLLVNHEYSPGVGHIRAHGADGSYISRWKVHKDTLEVVEGDDLIQEIYAWDWGTETFVMLGNEPLDRMCSADLPLQTALYNSATGLGSQNMVHFNGEETCGGRALAHVLSGEDARKSFELAHLGYCAFENILINPMESDMTLAIMPDDSKDGEVYIYIGTKQDTGNDVEKAGLVGGILYALTVPGEPYEMDPVNGIDTIESFTLKTIGAPGNRPMNGTETTMRGLDINGTYFPMDPNSAYESLKMAGPEDGVWDLRPGYENTFWFVTKGSYTAASLSGGEKAPSRLFKLEFEDIKYPTLGGTMTIMWQYLGSFDNICFDFMDGQPKLYIQEDLGANPVLGKIFEYDITTGTPQELAAFDSQISRPGGTAFLSMSAESAGIIPLPWLGEGYFAVTVQVHTSDNLTNPGEQVEHGQLVIMHVDADHAQDVVRSQAIASGELWDYLVDGSDPRADWKAVGFTVEAPWNVNTNGTETGPVASPIGYGEEIGVNSIATDVGQPEPIPLAYFFRRDFDLSDPASVVDFELALKIDGGAVVYMNGVEVARVNMPMDVEVSFETAATPEIVNKRDWQSIHIGCMEGVELMETGNVLAVSIHRAGCYRDKDCVFDQEWCQIEESHCYGKYQGGTSCFRGRQCFSGECQNETCTGNSTGPPPLEPNDADSSDFRMDADLVAIYASPEVVDAVVPAAPTGLFNRTMDFASVTLAFDAQDDAKYFRIERQLEGDVTWQTIEKDLPGDFDTFVDSTVNQGATYSYRMSAYHTGGHSACSDILTGVTVP